MKGLLFTYALTAFGVIGAIRSPVIGLYVYVAFAVMRPQFLWSFAGDLDGISWAVGVAMLASWAARGFGKWQFGRGRGAVIALLAFGFWAALSALQARYSAPAQVFLTEMLKYVLPFLVGVTTLRGDKDARTLLWVIVVSQGYVAYEMNMSYFAGYNRAQDAGFGGMDNNCFGVALVGTLGPAMALVLSSKTWKARGVAALCAAFILHTILLTFSRGAMVGMLAMLFLSIFMMPLRPRNLAAVLVVALLALRLTGPQLMARYRSVGAEQLDGSADSRIELWKDCWEVALANPIFGIGPENWPRIAHEFGWPALKSAHSAWMQAMADLGFPGFLLLFSFYMLGAIRLWPMAVGFRRGVDGRTAILASGVIMSLVGYMVSAQFVSLQGLELPYYVMIAGVALLKESPQPAPAAVTREVRSVAPPVRLAPFGVSRQS